MLGRVVPDERRPGADRRDDQEHAEDLPLRAGRHRDERRRRCSRAARRRLRRPRFPRRVRRGQRARDQHHAAERLRRSSSCIERGGAGRAGRQLDPELLGQLARDRDRQGPAVRARRADATHPRRRGRRRQRDRRGRSFFNYRADEGFAYYDDDSAWFNMLWVGGYTSRRRRRWSRTEGIKPFPTTGARKLHSRTSFLYAATGDHARRCACASPGSARSTSWPSLDADGERLRRLADLPGDAAARHPGGALLVVHPLRQPDPLDAADAAALPARRQPVLPDTGGERERGRLDDGHVRSRASPTTTPEGNWIQTDAGQGLVPDPAALQPARVVLRQELAAGRDRARDLETRSSWSKPEDLARGR